MSKGTQLVKPASYAALILLLFIVPIFVRGAYPLHVLIMVGISIILTSSLRTIATTGQISLAHAGFMAIGAYTSALLMMKLGLPFWATFLIGGMSAALIALLVGYPFVRVRRVYFAMLTLFLGVVIRLTIMEWRGLTGGTSGLLNIPPPNPIVIPGLLNITFDSKVTYYYLILVLVLISLLFLYRIDSSRVGRTLLAIQQGDFVAESVGINVTNFKVLAWCVGCFFAGIAGSFYAHYIRVLTPDSFGVPQAIYIVVYMVVGGRRRFSGAIVGAFIFTLIPEVFRGLKQYQPFVFVGLLFIVIYFLPGGLVELPEAVRARIRKRREANVGDA
ncbi:MAG: branched-chain amino acid ABC transporter permease [Dehalococcoidia bacterium]|jgi:branched-chain amino acid transport system permease protein|nr:branched-chain amino acid ABC transporter permease [Dehalococcoidia bacterium]